MVSTIHCLLPLHYFRCSDRFAMLVVLRVLYPIYYEGSVSRLEVVLTILLFRVVHVFTGVELHGDVIEHCKASIAKWKTNVVEERGEISTFHFMDNTADIQLIKGNGLNIVDSKGESVVGFDRIYIGAAVDKQALANITKLLSPGGILVGPGEMHYCIYTVCSL